MAQPRQYENGADRQAACRKRRKQTEALRLPATGLPALPGVATTPGWGRWRKAMAQIEALMTVVEAEMEIYRAERSERWQESESAEEFQERLDALRNAIEQVTDCLASW